MKIDSTRRVLRLVVPVILVCFSSMLPASVSYGQADDSVETIKADQERLAERYKQLEAKLFSLHEFEKDSNPGRSKLLQKAFLQSQEKMTNVQLNRAVKLINDGKFKDAEKMQAEALTNLTEMLKLLQAEDRDQQIRDDIDRYKEYAKEVDRLLRIQKGIRGQTEAGVDQGRLGKSEESAAKRTAELAKKIDAENQAKAGAAGSGEESDSDADPESDDDPDNEGDSEGDSEEDSEDNEGAGEKGNSEGSEGEPSEGSGSEGEPSEGSPSEGAEGREGQPGESGEPSESQSGSPSSGEPSSGEPSGGQSGEGSESPQEPQETDPVQQRIEAAQKKMEEASKALDDAKRDNATKKMEEAEKELAEAKKELEEILRQLREEEVDSKLKMLEERFRSMLEQQTRVNESTNKLAQTPKEARTTEFEISANRLAGDQKVIATAAGRALLLLKEDATSIAFPVTVEEMQQDMFQVANRLSAAKVNEVTQEIEADIVETLNELIEALEVIQEEREEQDQQQQDSSQQQQGQPGDEPLVDRIAELKMLKSLQQRVFKRHQRYAKYLDDPNDPVGVSQEPDIVAALERLAERQAQLTEITRQLVNEINE